MTVIYTKIILSIVIGGFAGLAAVALFNRMPAGWLCDVGEEPPAELQDPQIQRVKGWPWRWVYAGLFACLCLRLIFTPIPRPPAGLSGLPAEQIQLIAQCQLTLACLFACWAMLLIGLADLKYMIIPDQLVILLGVSALGFMPLHGNVWQPLGGLALGGGVMLIVALMGRFAFRREVMGFGDVKLCAAMGLVLGVRGMIFALAAASILSGLVAGVRLARKSIRRDDLQPLGPFLCGAGIFYLFILWPFVV